MYQVTTVNTMTLDGGIDCFDFINSGFDMESGVITERLHTYNDLLVLAGRLQLTHTSDLQRLQKLAAKNEEESHAALKTTLNIRMLLHDLFAAFAQKPAKDPDPHVLSGINGLFSEALKYRVLIPKDGGLQFSFELGSAGLMAPAWLFVLSAYDLLRSDNLRFVKQCQGCSWLFLDQTKNHRKKWCSMESCGNREKTKKYYAGRKRSEKPGRDGAYGTAVH